MNSRGPKQHSKNRLPKRMASYNNVNLIRMQSRKRWVNNMRHIVVSFLMIVVISFIFVNVTPVMAQEKMTKDEWQSQMAAATAKVADLQAQLKKLGDDMNTLKGQSDKLDADLKACQDALYGMLGVTAADVDAFDKELTGMEN